MFIWLEPLLTLHIAQQQEQINRQQQTIDDCHTLMKQLMEKSDRKRSSKKGKKNRTHTS